MGTTTAQRDKAMMDYADYAYEAPDVERDNAGETIEEYALSLEARDAGAEPPQITCAECGADDILFLPHKADCPR